MKIIILISVLIICQLASKSFAGRETGGGNSYGGRLLESYIQNPKELSAYKKILNPLQKKLSAKGYFDKYFDHSLVSKTWYFVPGPLNQLPSTHIGSMVATKQVALQDFESVWIDKDLFKKLTLKDQADLLLHEVLMGIKLLQFASKYEQCIVILKNSEELCEDKNKVRIGKVSDLTPSDYEEIRKTVFDLENLPSNTSYEDITNLLAKRNFSIPFFPFYRDPEKIGMFGSEFIQFLKTSQLSNNWPKYLYPIADFYKENSDLVNNHIAKPTLWVAKGKCQLNNFEYQNGYLGGNYISQRTNQPAQVFKLNFAINLNTFYLSGVDFENQLDPEHRTIAGFNSTINQSIPGRRSVGDHLLSIVFLSDRDGNLDGVHIRELVIIKEDNQALMINETFMVVKDGIDEVCSVNSKSILYP